jgi:hypothetical protein
LDTETKAEAVTRFKKIFADQPEPADLAGPATLPASLWAAPVDGVSSAALTRRLIDELPAAGQVMVPPCPMPTTAQPAPPTEPS